MHDAEARELGVLEAGNHPEDAFLFAKAQVGLEANEVVCRRRGVLGAQLHGSPGALTRTRIGKPNWFECTMRERIAPSTRDFLDWLARCEELATLKIFFDNAARVDELVNEGFVFLTIHRSVEIVGRVTFVIA